jgi:hypothetical protein
MKQESKIKSNRGGARAGAGRPKGSRDQVSVRNLLETLDLRTGGASYEEILVDDFLSARLANDTQLMLKYHNLISNKVLNTLHRVEETTTADTVTAKAAAFAEAISILTGRKN